MIQLDKIDKKILNIIQLNFPLDTHPFKTLSKEIGISEKEVIDRISRLKKEGAIRRIGPIINSKEAGRVGTLVALKAPDKDIDDIAEKINVYPEVSHNYLRSGNYNIWFTLSASNQMRLEEILYEIQKEVNCPMINLPTSKLFKIEVSFKIK